MTYLIRSVRMGKDRLNSVMVHVFGRNIFQNIRKNHSLRRIGCRFRINHSQKLFFSLKWLNKPFPNYYFSYNWIQLHSRQVFKRGGTQGEKRENDMLHDGGFASWTMMTIIFETNLENANISFRKVFVVKAARASTFELILKVAPEG